MTDKTAQPEVIVSITRYTVSVLPADDINHKYFALQVELKPKGWVVTDGHTFYAEDGTWQPSAWRAHHFADYDDALAFARETAPEMTVNGHTAVEAYHRTHPAAEESHVVVDGSDDPEHIDDCPGCLAFTLTGHRIAPASTPGRQQ